MAVAQIYLSSDKKTIVLVPTVAPEGVNLAPIIPAGGLLLGEVGHSDIAESSPENFAARYDHSGNHVIWQHVRDALYSVGILTTQGMEILDPTGLFDQDPADFKTSFSVTGEHAVNKKLRLAVDDYSLLGTSPTLQVHAAAVGGSTWTSVYSGPEIAKEITLTATTAIQRIRFTISGVGKPTLILYSEPTPPPAG